MIRPLRQYHRRAIFTLWIVLPVAFAVGIVARKPVPEVDSLPAALAPPATQFESPVWQRGDLFPKSRVQLRLLREPAGTGRFAAGFSAPKDVVWPDLFVYWVAGSPNLADALPDNATLLGAFGPAPLPIPDQIMETIGEMVLFSLADNVIVDVSRPIRFREAIK